MKSLLHTIILPLLIGYSNIIFSQRSTTALYQSKQYSVFADSIVENNFSARAISSVEIVSNYLSNSENLHSEKMIPAKWKLAKDVTAFPQYHCGYPITEALYNLSLEEMINAVEPDSTFRTGKLWSGVWTRDISYSIILSMAYLQPRVAINSLLKKVNKKGRIIQDTGTGGAYPISTDREIWAVAAWEIYKATGDNSWLEKAFLIIKNSIDDDLTNVYDNATGLVHGESSFLDWREQTYPRWMRPADIYESENLGTNAVHYEVNIVLSNMAHLLNRQRDYLKYKAIAEKIKTGINHYLWMNDKGYYAQYLYGRNFKTISPRAEALGEALCVLFNIAGPSQQKLIIKNMPVTSFGIPCIYPQIPGISPYHNNAVWPFVQSYWALASAKVANETSVLESICAIDRAAALFLTNKENFVADDGDYNGTQINSSNMLWSLSGNLSIIHRVIFGMSFQPDQLIFNPFVPKVLKCNRSLTNFKYRNAILDITLVGYGNKIKTFLLDGKQLAGNNIAATLKGKHLIKIILANNDLPIGKINKTLNYVSPETPILIDSAKSIRWESITGAVKYKVIKNGKFFLETSSNKCLGNSESNAEYQVIAIDKNGVESFSSEPLLIKGNKSESVYELEDFYSKANLPYKGFLGKGFIEISKTIHTSIHIPVEIKKEGIYIIYFRYANGNGPIKTENKCAIRTLKENNSILGTIVFPQRGKDEWSNWGNSNSLQVNLSKGKHILTLSFEPSNENMNGDINQAMIDNMCILSKQ
jgi:hypothetical protein